MATREVATLTSYLDLVQLSPCRQGSPARAVAEEGPPCWPDSHQQTGSQRQCDQCNRCKTAERCAFSSSSDSTACLTAKQMTACLQHSRQAGA